LLIGIDTRFAVWKRRGIGQYTLNLIENLCKIDNKNQYILYVDREDIEQILPKSTNLAIKKLTPSNYFAWEQILLPKQAAKDELDILHCTGNTAPRFISSKINLVLTLHDVMFLKDKKTVSDSNNLYQRLGRIYRKVSAKSTAQKIKKIITVSSFSKQDILSCLPKLSPDSISVTHEAADQIFDTIEYIAASKIVEQDFGLIAGGYLLTLGGLDPRKNTKLTIKTFSNLKNEQKIKEKLVVVGIPNWQGSEFYQLAYSLGLTDEIIFTDFITQYQLGCLYKCAIVFVYPSLYEGFGIPPLEAMASGTPVITSNVTSIPEIVGDAALQINPTSQAELENAICKLLNDSLLRDDLIKKGLAQSQKFSWRKMAEETLRIYESVGQNRT
jgi:glycosyltransferase involved in cell wall biosynthesis